MDFNRNTSSRVWDAMIEEFPSLRQFSSRRKFDNFTFKVKRIDLDLLTEIAYTSAWKMHDTNGYIEASVEFHILGKDGTLLATVAQFDHQRRLSKPWTWFRRPVEGKTIGETLNLLGDSVQQVGSILQVETLVCHSDPSWESFPTYDRETIFTLFKLPKEGELLTTFLADLDSASVEKFRLAVVHA